MIVVKVELWPGGDESRSAEIARMNIANVSYFNRPEEIHDYQYSMMYSTTADGVRFRPQAADGQVKHDRKETVWHLIFRCLSHFGIEP